MTLIPIDIILTPFSISLLVWKMISFNYYANIKNTNIGNPIVHL